MFFIKKIFEKLNLFYISFLVAILTPATSLAQDAKAVPDLMETFRHQLLATLSGAFLGDGIIDFSTNGVMGAVLGVCVIIAIFQVVHDHLGTDKFLSEWVKIPIMAVIVLNIVGQSTLLSGLFPPSASHPSYAGMKKTLDIEIYFALEDIFDEVAGKINSSYGSNGPNSYLNEYKKLMINLRGFSSAISNCNNPGVASACFAAEFAKIKNSQSGTPASGNVNPNDPKTSKEAPGDGEKSSGWSFNPFNEVISAILAWYKDIYFTLPLLLIQAVLVILDYVRLFINYFTLITFSLMTAMSLFFCKLLAPFLVLPKQRTKVLAAFKMPLSATMYGFMSSLIIALASLIIKGVNAAILDTLIAKTSAGGVVDNVDLFQIVLASTFCIAAVLGIQIGAMKQIPGLCRKLWDLSLTEVVEFGKTVVEAGMGVLKTGAMLAVGGVAAAGAGLAAGASAVAGGSGAASAAMQGLKAGASSAMKTAKAASGGGGSGGGPSGLKSMISADTGGRGGGGGGGSDGSKGGDGSKSGGQKDNSSKQEGSLKFKDAKSALEDKGKGGALSGIKSIGGAVLGVAAAGAKAVGGLAMDGISVGMGKEVDVLGNLGKNSVNMMEKGSNVVDAIESHRSDAKEAKQIRQAENANTKQLFATGGGDKTGGEKIDSAKLAGLMKKSDEKTDFSAEDNKSLFKMITDGDTGSLEKEEQENLKKMGQSKSFKEYAKSHVESMTSPIESGNAQESDHLEFSKFINNGKAKRLTDNGVIKKGGDTDKIIESAEKSSTYKSFETERKSSISSSTKGLVTGRGNASSKSVNLDKAKDFQNLNERDYVMDNDWKDPTLQSAKEASQHEILAESDKNLEKLEKSLEKAKKKKDINKIFDLKKEIEQANKSKAEHQKSFEKANSTDPKDEDSQ